MSKPQKPPQTRHLPQAVQQKEDTERILFEVPQEKHNAIKARAALLGMSIKTYVVHAIEKCAVQAKRELAAEPSRKPFEGSRREKRISIDIPPEQASRIRDGATEFKTVREYVLRCIEIDMRHEDLRGR